MPASDLSRPPKGVTPSFHATPQPSEVQRGLWGIYGGSFYLRLLATIIQIEIRDFEIQNPDPADPEQRDPRNFFQSVTVISLTYFQA